jgi:ADP-ribosylglycohydrolase
MTTTEQLNLAKTSLLGLSIGDAFGETFFGPEVIIADRIQNRVLQEGDWFFTDDTVMAIGIYNILSRNNKIDQDQLASEFAENYFLDQNRGYGGTVHSILRDFAAGKNWKEVSSAVFDGMGSMGNGAAMRSGPIGAYFHENVEEVVEQATLAAEVTHFHPEAIAGAIAVALAACYCTRHGINGKKLQPEKFYDFIISNIPGSMVRSKIEKARTLPSDYDIRTIVSVLGNGIQLSAQDTVPFALWCAINHSDSFSDAIWRGVSGLGDRDTIGAITGSIVVMATGANNIPEQWIAQTERFSSSPFFK